MFKKIQPIVFFTKLPLVLGLLLSVCKPYHAMAQCAGEDITESHTGTCLPELVRFVVTPAFPAGSVYYWDPGTGTGPLLGGDTFYYQYNNGGSYGMTVDVTTPSGAKCTVSKPKGFLVFSAATSLGFYADQTLYCTLPATVNLHDSSGNTTGRDWYLNGNLYSDHSKDISYVDNVSGSLSVTLVVYGQSGCPQIVSKQNYIQIGSLQPNFCSVLTENSTHDAISVVFTPGFDTTGDHITEIDWDFAGGTPSSYSGYTPPAIQYTDLTSPHSVTLTVKTSGGCTGTFKKTDLVRKYYTISKANVCQNSPAVLNYQSTNAPGQAHGFSFVASNINILSSKEDSSFKYMINFGTYGIANMKFGILYSFSTCTDSLIVPALFDILPSAADVSSVDRNQCSAPADVHFHAIDGNPGADTVTYTWVIYDSLMNQVTGSPIGPITASDTGYTFMTEGLYSVMLIATNNDGCTDSVLKSGFVRIGVPDNDFKLSTNNICAGDTLHVTNLTTSQDNPNNPLWYTWVFQDQDSANIVVTSATRNPKIVFQYPGVYSLTYTISSYQGLCPSTKTENAVVTVKGVAANILVSPNNGCVPLTKTLTADIIDNKPAGALAYTWRINPSIGVVIQDSTAPSTDVVLNNTGCYNVLLNVKSSIGCSATVFDGDFVCIGTKADFTVPARSCRNDTLAINNTSTLNPDQYQWTITPPNGVYISSDTVANPKIVIVTPGCYTIGLQTSKKSQPGCFDTISHTVCINVPPVLKSVYSPDTGSHCAPKLDQFFASAVGASTFYWDYGDGARTTVADSEPQHAYIKNNNTGFTIKTVAIDVNGCPSDTLTLPDYIKIAGPEPAFTITSKPPCNGGTIDFTNNSTHLYKYYFLYGDNSGVDSNQIKPHFYRFVDYSKDSNIYVPSLFAYDASGCVAIATDTVKLYRPPTAGFFTNDTNGCAPYTVQFTDTSKYATTYWWNFGDGTTDSTVQPGHIFTQASPSGSPYQVTLTATTDKGCTSTAKPVFIRVKPVPVIKMILPKSNSICYQDSIHFSSTSDIKISQYSWGFGDGNLSSDTSALQNPIYHYTFAGRHTVSLKATSASGCSDSVSDSTSLFILDSLPPAAPVIDYVSVTPSNSVVVVFKKESYLAFDSNTVYREPVPTKIYRTVSPIDTVVYDAPPGINVNTQPYGYTVTSSNACGHTSAFAKAHYTVYLGIGKYPNQGLILNWTKYVGWDTVAKYVIYRQSSGKGMAPIASVPGTDTTYIDSLLCPGRYYYYITAVDQGHPYSSNSNMVSDSPDYVYQTSPITLTDVTVINDRQVQVSWTSASPINLKYYAIDRSEGLQDWQYNYATDSAGTTYIDGNVEVDKYPYRYRVKIVDRCGIVSPPSNIGTSILLQGKVINDNRQMNWNEYMMWAGGVQNYHVQLHQDDGSFKDVSINPSTDTLFADSLKHDELSVPTCYRVYAIQNTNNSGYVDTSYSNVLCINLPARLFFPNAFSPNSDDINDDFRPIGLSILNGADNINMQYDFKIYNRWGELVFETHDFNQGWDGTFKGQKLTPDVYIYSVDARGYDASTFHTHGTVMLVR